MSDLVLTVTLDADDMRGFLAGFGVPQDGPPPTRAMLLYGTRHVPAPVRRSGPRPPGTPRARWAAARRLDTLRRRRHRRHGVPTRPLPTRHVYPHVQFERDGSFTLVPGVRR